MGTLEIYQGTYRSSQALDGKGTPLCIMSLQMIKKLKEKSPEPPMGSWDLAIAPLRLCWLQGFMKKRLVSIKEYLEDLTCQALEGTHEWLQGSM